MIRAWICLHSVLPSGGRESPRLAKPRCPDGTMKRKSRPQVCHFDIQQTKLAPAGTNTLESLLEKCHRDITRVTRTAGSKHLQSIMQRMNQTAMNSRFVVGNLWLYFPTLVLVDQEALEFIVDLLKLSKILI